MGIFKFRKTRRSKWFNLILGAILVVLIPLGLASFRNPDQAQASWYNDNWNYRQTVAITNSGSAQTDFQISMTLDTATLITAGKMQSDCDDIRVLDNTGKVLPHWVEQGTNACNTSTTAIWTKIPSINTTGITVFIYYGNATATNVEDGNKVFHFFDDFIGSSLSSKWSVLGGSTPTVSGGNARVAYAGGTDNSIAASYTPLSQSVVEFRGIQIMQSPSYRNRFYFGTLSGTTFSASTLDDGVAGGNKDFGFFYDGANAPAEIYLGYL